MSIVLCSGRPHSRWLERNRANCRACRTCTRHCLHSTTGGLAITAIDPDVVTETNCVRQPFCRTEIGLPKATVLVHRINSFWGLNWQGMQAEVQQITKGSEVDVVIGCVDTRKARRAIDAWVRKSRVLYWLDLGNTASTGQFVLGQPNNTVNRKKTNRLPTVAELYPEILAPDDKHGQQPACSAAEALTRQEPFINQNLAYQALAMLTQLLRRGSLSFHGGFCNLAAGQLVPLLDRGITRHSARVPRLQYSCHPKATPRRCNPAAPAKRLPPICLIPPEPHWSVADETPPKRILPDPPLELLLRPRGGAQTEECAGWGAAH